MKSTKLPLIATLLSLSISASVHAIDEAPIAPAVGKNDSKSALTGAWILKLDDGTHRLKIIADGKWVVTQSDPDTGAVVFHHGGTYTFDGKTYVETVKYANTSTENLIGQKFTFKITMKKDAFRQEGVGNPFTEDWSRAGK